LGCVCTGGNGCDPGLSCVAGICSMPGTSAAIQSLGTKLTISPILLFVLGMIMRQ